MSLTFTKPTIVPYETWLKTTGAKTEKTCTRCDGSGCDRCGHLGYSVTPKMQYDFQVESDIKKWHKAIGCNSDFSEKKQVRNDRFLKAKKDRSKMFLNEVKK